VEIRYRLPESYLTIAGTIQLVTDTFDRGGQETPKSDSAAASVAIGLRADRSAAGDRSFDLERLRSDDDLTVSQTTDGRLASISYKSVGIGARVVEAGAKVIAFVGSIAGAILKVGAAASGAPVAGLGDIQTPDEKARTSWDGDHPLEAELYGTYKELIRHAACEQMKARDAAAKAQDAADQSKLMARARRLQQLISDAQGELDRIDTLYRAWRASTITTRREERTYELGVGVLPLGEGETPDPNDLADGPRQVWEQLGVIVTMSRAGGHAEHGAGSLDAGRWDQEEQTDIVWRLPRLTRFWIWRGSQDGTVILDRTFPVAVVDRFSHLDGVTVSPTLFGEKSGQIDFGDLGVPTKVIRAEKGAIGAFADALKGIPDAVVGGLEAAGKAQTALTGVLDAADVRRLAALERRVKTKQQELEEKGLAATADDYAELKRLQQQVEIADAEGKLAPPSPPSELDQLKAQLDLASTRAALAAVERWTATDNEMADVRAEIQLLDGRLKLQEGRPPGS
jgi:hypothetical protein